LQKYNQMYTLQPEHFSIVLGRKFIQWSLKSTIYRCVVRCGCFKDVDLTKGLMNELFEGQFFLQGCRLPRLSDTAFTKQQCTALTQEGFKLYIR